jgi:hypothetical protein
MTNAVNVSQVASSTYSFKNRIINGGMVIDQRNAGASQIPSANAYTLDRWQYGASQASKITTQQLTSVPPNNFYNYLGITVSTAVTSIGSTDYFQISQKIEANNMSDFGWGTASGQSVTVSFWTKCSNAITLCGALQSNSSPYTSYPFLFTINSANTWQYITVSIPAPASGTNWSTGTNIGIYFQINLAVGTTYSGTANAWNNSNLFGATGASSLMGTVGNYLYITGVQLEVGTQATSFDFRDYGRELILCQRYFYKVDSNFITCFATTTGRALGTLAFPTTMRATPTATGTDVTIMNNWYIANISGVYSYESGGMSANGCDVGYYFVSGTSFTAGTIYRPNAFATFYVSYTAEL